MEANQKKKEADDFKPCGRRNQKDFSSVAAAVAHQKC